MACNDDLGGWLIAQRILGVGPALASAMLMAHDPERFTVIDVRAYRSVVLLAQTGGLTGNGVDPTRLIERAGLVPLGPGLPTCTPAGRWRQPLAARCATSTAPCSPPRGVLGCRPPDPAPAGGTQASAAD